MGEGWHPNETVSINIHESSGDPDTNLTATADVIGSFINQQFIVQPSDQGVTFFATATGHASRWTAQTIFTDGNVKAFAAPSGTTFTLTKSTFSNATCSGAPSSTATATGVNSTSGNTSGVGNTESVRLEAAASSDQNATFTNWSSSNPFTVVAPRAICAPGFSGGGSRDYFANYAGGADLSITKTDSPDPVAPGGTLTYSINVGNAGPNAAVAVTMSDPLPSQTTFQSVAPPAGWSCTTPPVGTTGTVSCTMSSLASGAPASFTIVVQVTPATSGGTTISNTATVSSSGTSDPTSTNNTATATTTVTVTASSDLSITKTDAPDPVAAGAALTYTLTVSNAGPSTAAAPISVTDSLPPGVTFQGASGAGWTCSGTNTGVTCTRASTLPPGAAPPITIFVTAPNEGSTITNTASVSSSTSDPDSSNNTATASTTVIASADLSITKTDAPDPSRPGATPTYTLAVNNNGPSTAASVTVTDPLPPGTTFQSIITPAGWTCTTPAVGSAGTVNCTTGPTANGATVSFTIVAQVSASTPDGSTLTNTATVSSVTFDPNTANNAATANTDVRAADLSITKSAPAEATSGTDITYHFTVTNNGPTTSTGGTVTDVLTVGVTFKSASADCAFTAPSTVGCSFGTLAIGSSVSLDIVVHISVATTGESINTAGVKGNETETNQTNNTATATTVVSPQTTPGKVTGGGVINVPDSRANFGFVAQRNTTGGPASGNLNYVDHASGQHVHGPVTSLTIIGNSAEFGGPCGTSCTFTVAVQDNTEPDGSDGDVFIITVTASPPYGAGDTIRSGNIQVHRTD